MEINNRKFELKNFETLKEYIVNFYILKFKLKKLNNFNSVNFFLNGVFPTAVIRTRGK